MTRRNPEKNADTLRKMSIPSSEVLSFTGRSRHLGSAAVGNAYFNALDETDAVSEMRNQLFSRIVELEDNNAELRIKNATLDADRQEYHEDSRTDALTGLLNQTGFEEAFEARKRSNPNSKIAIVFIDLNDLKMLNDTYSHAIGDEAIKLLASMIEKVTRNGDMVARIHGDEFALGLIESDDAEPKRGEALDLESYMTELPNKIRQALEVALVPDDVPEGLIKNLLTILRTVKFAYGGVVCDEEALKSPLHILMGQAEELMYTNKRDQKRIDQIARSENSIEYSI